MLATDLAIATQTEGLGALQITDRLVEDIRRVWNRGTVSTLVAVGRLILNGCYAGEIERWRSRETNGQLRRLERHRALPFTRKTIYLALHFYDLSLKFPEQRFLQELGVGHVRTVLGLSTPHQKELLSGAQENGWTIAELTERANQIRRAGGSRKTGRPPANPETRLKKLIQKHFLQLENLLSQPSVLESCSPARAVEMIAALDELKKQVLPWVDSREADALNR